MRIIEFGGREAPAEYLGDGVYAIFDGSGVWLHANDHLHPSDKVYLEPQVLEALNKFYNNARGVKA
jgi:hypothetical protein